MTDRPVLTFPKPILPELEKILGEPQHANPEIVSIAEVLDITPAHEPIRVAHQMVEHAVGAKAGLYVLIGADDELSWKMAGHARKDLLWALERMKQELMNTED